MLPVSDYCHAVALQNLGSVYSLGAIQLVHEIRADFLLELFDHGHLFGDENPPEMTENTSVVTGWNLQVSFSSFVLN